MRYVASLLLLLVVASSQAQTPTYTFLKKITLTGDGKWDYLKMDGDKERLFVTHQDRVNVVSLKEEKQIGEITGLNGIHGVALVKDLNKGYISNGGDNVITVFDYTTLKVLKSIKTEGKKADAIMYDKFSKQVFVFNNGSGNAVVINPQTDEVVGMIELGGAPEFAVSNGKGDVFVNNEETQEITVIDAKARTVKAHYSLLPNEVPTGLAMDVDNNRLFSVCRKSKTMVVVDAANGKIIQTLPIGGVVDAAVYDKKLKLVFASNGDGTVTIIKQKTADSYEVVQTLTTKVGSKTMIQQGKTHRIYLGSAEYKEGTKDIIPNTFGVLVYGIK